MRDLVVPLRYLVDNAVRDLVDRLGDALSATEREHDASTLARTLMALLQAPGTLTDSVLRRIYKMSPFEDSLVKRSCYL